MTFCDVLFIDICLASYSKLHMLLKDFPFYISQTSVPITNNELVRGTPGYARHHLTIRLRARDFYAVIVDEGEARINYHRIEIEGVI